MSAQHTPGPWRWEFNKQAKSVYLVGGKPRYDKTVMQFARWGMNHATPLFNSQITGNEFNIMERICDMPDWTKPFKGLEHHAWWRMDVTHPDAILMAAAPELLAALVVAQEFISLERNVFADCNVLFDGTFDADEAAELADYDTALLQINAAILKATGPAA